MGRILPISILNEQEVETDFRTGTHFSILDVIAAKIQLGKLCSQLIKRWNRRTRCKNEFFSGWIQTQVTQRKSSLEIIQVRSASDDILFCTDKQSQKSELQWMNPFMVNLLVVEPPLPTQSCWPFPPHAVPDVVFPKHWGWHPRRMMNVSICRGMALPDCLSTLFQPCPCYCGISKLPPLLDLKGGEAGEEKLERSLKRAGNCPVGSWAVGSQSEVPWYLKVFYFCASFLFFCPL